jgi:hypothetical protein
VQTIPNISRIVGAVAVQVSNVLVLDKMIEYFLNTLGIVFYTNIVKYPTVLSVHVLPAELKELAISRLEAIKLRVPDFKYVKENIMLLPITLGQIEGILNYLRCGDTSAMWNECIEFNHRLDNSRRRLSFENVTPEFKPYITAASND